MKMRLTFEEYYVKYYDKVFKTIRSKILNHEQAEDLTMEVFTICYEKFDTFDETRASFGTWLYVIVNNKLKNYYRDKKQFDDIDEITEFTSSFEDDIIAAEYLGSMRNALNEALKTLNDTQREIIILKYFQNKNAPGIAASLGMSAGNVRVNLSRAIAKLQQYFEQNNIRWEN